MNPRNLPKSMKLEASSLQNSVSKNDSSPKSMKLEASSLVQTDLWAMFLIMPCLGSMQGGRNKQEIAPAIS